MKPVPRDSRTNNTGTGKYERCDFCADGGYVQAGSSFSRWLRPDGTVDAVEYLEYAPCPYCLAGYREEFPVPGTNNKQPTRTPWGEDGYWQGRDTADLERLSGVPLPPAENARRMRELAERMGAIVKEMPE